MLAATAWWTSYSWTTAHARRRLHLRSTTFRTPYSLSTLFALICSWHKTIATSCSKYMMCASALCTCCRLSTAKSSLRRLSTIFKAKRVATLTSNSVNTSFTNRWKIFRASWARTATTTLRNWRIRLQNYTCRPKWPKRSSARWRSLSASTRSRLTIICSWTTCKRSSHCRGASIRRTTSTLRMLSAY